MENKVKIKRKINFQKIFCFASLIFILTCIFWYGGRFIYLYLENEKTIETTKTIFAIEIKTQNNNKQTFKKIKKDYYFHGEVSNNYVSYSNLLWRIIKVNEDNSILLVTDSIIGTLAYGNQETNYQDSSILQWLNSNESNSNSGIFDKILNEKEKYLTSTSTCIDTIDNIENITCENKYNENYIGLLSLNDYAYTGGSKSFINNDRYNYLSNKNSDNEIWYINNEGKLNTTDGTDIIGIKATITLSPNIELKKGNGTYENPYNFEETTNLIGSYVKLDNDIWRIYEENNGIIKLILENTILDNNSMDKLKYTYSKTSYYHNDTKKGSLAYYLNNNYYNSLSYKDLIIENTYTNGFYSDYNDYNYQDILSKTIETKVSIPSLSDIILNDTLNDYFTNTGTKEESSFIYIRKETGTTSSKHITSENYIIPCISINKDNLKIGSGSLNDPYRTE